NIAGFRIGRDGAPTPIPGSVRPLGSAAAGPAQIQFTPDGRALVVTEKATSTITTYTVDADGLPGGPNTQASAGETPFGFSFNQRGDLVVSEAAGGAPGASSASTYRVARDGALELIAGAVPTTQSAACWIAISQNGAFAYTTNTGSGTVSSLAIGAGGKLTLVDPVAGLTGPGTRPQDAAFTPGGRFLYVRNDAGTIGAFRADGSGGLVHLGDFGPLPAGANGIVAR
ncbi:MAG TPA: beta-propeller fold lactonase family protein, partial [Methylomirabilota bacterium]|nr:beta-propeller fold lactonase family protein [Methylomirabilota bacterium]